MRTGARTLENDAQAFKARQSGAAYQVSTRNTVPRGLSKVIPQAHRVSTASCVGIDGTRGAVYGARRRYRSNRLACSRRVPGCAWQVIAGHDQRLSIELEGWESLREVVDWQRAPVVASTDHGRQGNTLQRHVGVRRAHLVHEQRRHLSCIIVRAISSSEQYDRAQGEAVVVRCASCCWRRRRRASCCHIARRAGRA